MHSAQARPTSTGAGQDELIPIRHIQGVILSWAFRLQCVLMLLVLVLAAVASMTAHDALQAVAWRGYIVAQPVVALGLAIALRNSPIQAQPLPPKLNATWTLFLLGLGVLNALRTVLIWALLSIEPTSMFPGEGLGLEILILVGGVDFVAVGPLWLLALWRWDRQFALAVGLAEVEPNSTA